jgi:uncharacterized protein YbjT (DUF2867 family)
MFLSPVTGARTRGDVLIPDATGFLGMELMARLLEDGDRRVWALVRAPSEKAAAERRPVGRAEAGAGVRGLPEPVLT